MKRKFVSKRLGEILWQRREEITENISTVKNSDFGRSLHRIDALLPSNTSLIIQLMRHVPPVVKEYLEREERRNRLHLVTEPRKIRNADNRKYLISEMDSHYNPLGHTLYATKLYEELAPLLR